MRVRIPCAAALMVAGVVGASWPVAAEGRITTGTTDNRGVRVYQPTPRATPSTLPRGPNSVMTCDAARRAARRAGYRDVTTVTCGGSTSTFTGSRLGQRSRITVDSATGRITSERAAP